MPPEDSLELFPESSRPSFDPSAPLADRMRPRSLDEVVGQDALVGASGPLRGLAAAGELPSLILWGPPGTGKTTVAARLLVLLANRDPNLRMALVAPTGCPMVIPPPESTTDMARAQCSRPGFPLT